MPATTASESTTTTTTTTTRGRGRGSGTGTSSRGNNRGGYGKYLRARGRGRGYGGRPAEFAKRLLLEGEGNQDEEEIDEEEAAERRAKYSRRQLASNADRYNEPEPELGSDGEPQVEPEVDLSALLEKQRLSDESAWTGSTRPGDDNDNDDDEGEVDMTLAHIGSQKNVLGSNKKGKVEQIEWDHELEEMSREKASADATRELKSRLRAKVPRLSAKPPTTSSRNRKGKESIPPPPSSSISDHSTEKPLAEAPPLPLLDESLSAPKDNKQEMEEFLDELLG